MGKPTPPRPPDPSAIGNAQAAANTGAAMTQAHLNAVNQQAPWGSTYYGIYGTRNIDGRDVPQYTQVVNLSPEQQDLYYRTTNLERQALDTGQTALSGAQSTLNQPFSNALDSIPHPIRSAPQQRLIETPFGTVDPRFFIDGAVPEVQTRYRTTGPQFSLNGDLPAAQTHFQEGDPRFSIERGALPNLPGAEGGFANERQRVEDAYLGRFNEDLARNRAASESQLNAMGLQRGSEAWNTEMQRLDRQQVDARNAAIQAGGAEQSRLFDLASRARGQLFGEEAAGTQTYNNAIAQQAAQNQALAEFANRARGQLFGEEAARAGIHNQAASQDTEQNRALAEFANAGAGQIFGQNAARTEAFNQAAAQRAAMLQANVGLANTAIQQRIDQDYRQAAFDNQARQQAIQEAMLRRSQPINELATLLGLGSNVQVPTGAPNFNTNVAPADITGAYALNQAGQQANYQQQMGARNAIFGGLSNLGGAALGGRALGKGLGIR